MDMARRLAAEFVGTFWLVLGGCGSAVLAAKFPDVGIGMLGVALAFGLTVVTAAYAFAHISGGHFNPAVTVGLWLGKRLDARYIGPYIVTQGGEHINQGGDVNGHTLVSVKDGEVVFEGRQRVRIAR